jgi:hypothetical protein
VLQRLVKSTQNNNYESLRFINSAGSFSPDGRYFAIAAKRKDRDDLVILDVKRGREDRRIRVELAGLQTPQWSPDGQQLVFTGFSAGFTDPFIINRDGTGLRRLTDDKFADLQPSWSPDGRTIAFVTDRGPATDFNLLRFGNLRIALLHLESGMITVLDKMDVGRNINPLWAPDGRSLALVSDRTGINNIFLYDLTDGQLYQLTNMFTGVQGITPLSPVLTWASQADRMAFVYYEDGQYSVYSLENPRSLRRAPYHGPPSQPIVTLLDAERRDSELATVPLLEDVANPNTLGGTTTPVTGPPHTWAPMSLYRTPSGFRPSAEPEPAEQSTTPPPITVRALLDSATLALPDTSEFTFRPYKVRFTADYVVRPTVGYARDNFGRGVFGGTAIALSDILATTRRLRLDQRAHQRGKVPGLHVNQAALELRGGFSQDHSTSAIGSGSIRTARRQSRYLLHADSQIRDSRSVRRVGVPLQPLQSHRARHARGERRGGDAGAADDVQGRHEQLRRSAAHPGPRTGRDVHTAKHRARPRQHAVRLRRTVRRLPLAVLRRARNRQLVLHGGVGRLSPLRVLPAVHDRRPRADVRPLRT